jgi:hypothetical protein
VPENNIFCYFAYAIDTGDGHYDICFRHYHRLGFVWCLERLALGSVCFHNYEITESKKLRDGFRVRPFKLAVCLLSAGYGYYRVCGAGLLYFFKKFFFICFKDKKTGPLVREDMSRRGYDDLVPRISQLQRQLPHEGAFSSSSRQADNLSAGEAKRLVQGGIFT